MRNSVWTIPQICTAIGAFTEAHGHPPGYQHFRQARRHGLPSVASCYKYAGTASLRCLWALAGIPEALWGLRPYRCQDCGVRVLLHIAYELPRCAILCPPCLAARVAAVRAVREEA